MQYDGAALTGEYNAADALLRRYVHGPGVDEPLVWYEGAGTGDRRYFDADNLGSPVSLTGASGVTATNFYDEYGVPGSGNTGRFGFTGQTWIAEAGLYYYKARMYNPKLGRFMQTDPILYDGGMNLYAYVENDPVNYTDPLGAAPEDCPTPLNCVGEVGVTGQRPPKWEEPFPFGSVHFESIGPFQPFVLSQYLMDVTTIEAEAREEERRRQTACNTAKDALNKANFALDQLLSTVGAPGAAAEGAKVYFIERYVKVPWFGRRGGPGGPPIETPDLSGPILPGNKTIGEAILPSNYGPAVQRAFTAQRNAQRVLDANNCSQPQ